LFAGFFENQGTQVWGAKIIPHRPRLVNRDKPLCCILAHLNFFGFFCYNKHMMKGKMTMTKYANKLIQDILCAILFVAIAFLPLWIWLALMKP
jgi:hypothetical protein